MHPVCVIPQEVHILEISHFPEPGKFQENFMKRAFEAHRQSFVTIEGLSSTLVDSGHPGTRILPGAYLHTSSHFVFLGNFQEILRKTVFDVCSWS